MVMRVSWVLQVSPKQRGRKGIVPIDEETFTGTHPALLVLALIAHKRPLPIGKLLDGKGRMVENTFYHSEDVVSKAFVEWLLEGLGVFGCVPVCLLMSPIVRGFLPVLL